MYTRIVNILQIIRGFSLLGKEVTNKVGRQMDSVVLDWDLRYERKLIVFKYVYRHIDTEVCMCMYTYTDTQIS